MSVLVVGANGYIGKALCRALEGSGRKVHAWTSRGGKHLDPDTGQLRSGVTIPDDTACVVYLAQFPHWRSALPDLSHLLNVNVITAATVARQAADIGAQRFIYASTGNVYAQSFLPLKESSPLRRDNWYGLSKVHAEECLELLRGEIEICVLRLFGVYGPGQIARLVPGLIARVQRREEVTIALNRDEPGDLDGLKVSLCYLDDAIRVFERIIDDGAPVHLNVAADKPSSIREIADRIGAVMGCTPRFQITKQYREGDLVADVSVLKERFGPRFTCLEDGIKLTLEGLGQASAGE